MQKYTQAFVALSLMRNIGSKTLISLMDDIIRRKQSLSTVDDLYRYLDEARPPRVKFSDESVEKAYNDARRLIYESERIGVGILTYFDQRFPDSLRKTMGEDGKFDPPAILYYKGNLDVLHMPSVAVIGTREPTREGKYAGSVVSSQLAEAGYNIVSGLALGCDTIGHMGALSVDGVTTAFLAHGLDSIYPSENTYLAERIIAQGGLLLSEYPVGTRCNQYRLVARDRLQAGLASATLVIQTGIKGGTMHAVRATQASAKPLLAIRYSDDVMAHRNVCGNAFLHTKGAIAVNKTTDVAALIRNLYAHSETEVRTPEQLTLF